MIARTRFALVPLFVAASACSLNQRPQPELAPRGIRIRVTSGTACAESTCTAGAPRATEGTLARVDDDSLLMYDPSRNGYAAFPVSAISRLEVYRGQEKGSLGNAARQGAKTAAIGAGVGAAIGALSGLLIPPIFGQDPDPGRWALAGAAQGTIEGAAAGAVAGAMTGPSLWQPVTVRQLREELCLCRIPAAAETTAPVESMP